MTTRIKTDICVIGGGSGGLSVASGAVQMGARVVLIEGGAMGGDCLNHGCVPSKALLAAGKAAHAQRSGAAFGVAPVRPQVDFAAAKDHVARTIATIAPHDSVERFEGLGVQVLQGYGRFISKTEVQVNDTIVTARRFVVATGSSPMVPPIDGLDHVPYLTNESIFDLRECPGHLLIIGGGPIGMEMAQAHARLGARVTVVEGASALGRDDPEAAAVVLAHLRDEGVEIIENAQVQAVRGRTGAVEVEVAGGTVFIGTHLLVAVGRKPNLERLNLEAAGVETTRAGVRVDAGLRSSNRHVYAIGDVAGQGQFTHLAGYHAGVVIRSAVLGLPARTRSDHIPSVTYTDPELAQIGLTEADARSKFGAQVQVVRAEMAGNDRAQAEGKTDGFIKVMVVRSRPVGVTIVGAQAGELMAPWALAIANGLKMSAMAGTVLPYPTLAEIGKRAAGAFFSPKLFDNAVLGRFVRAVQRFLP
ncbi:dihydrolipoyl dehydrogenase family protein [Roseicitreum antarcticum]|uniref:Pyruvate/2-oxoglutarate dehydrogenase complex, dihydrolipoamide dehydrogenase (E3) component n=1 Tax=Roseicitreum antarcticum TaxID=564137 RepID=A0A1H2X5S6_9RHOB|nr:FAD-dependent oxidoreductase [Roseicitreum antarcticum]SDW88145.1 Pyruvate/2-oxoglutarate dehydrogenase complex, dihydrolipoamide dehydrogenase (E3) component [Roseicitreum antarcticum]